MEMTTMSCERPTKEEIRVVVEYPKTPRERRRECCNAVGTPFVWLMDRIHDACRKCHLQLHLLYFFVVCAILFAMYLAIAFFYVWIPILMSQCQKSPRLDLKDVNVHAINVYQNSTLLGTPYQVNSDISVQLEAWNRNTVARCFTTIRRVAVSVDFKRERLLHQVVPLEGFGLKPRESRSMTLELRGENAPLKNEIGLLLSLEVRNSSNIELTLSFAARWMQNDRRADWRIMDCASVTKAPPTSRGGLVYRLCI